MKNNIPWDLIISHLKKETTEQEESILREWCNERENNQLLLELSSLWENIQKASESYNPDLEFYWKELKRRTEKQDKVKEKPSISLYKIRIASAVASVILLFSISLSFYIGKKTTKPEIKSQTYTALNGKSQMILPDGTSVWLNIGSTLIYQTSYLSKRTVQLEGEALFDVESDPKSPFIVEVNDIAIKVLGTRFNVQAYSGKENIQVALLEGIVSVLSNNKESIMNTGEIAYFNKLNRTLLIEKSDVDFESSWANQSYSFNSKNLAYICKYLEKWYNVTISLDPDIANSYIYTFTIKDEPLETILQIMSRINPISYSFDDGNKVTIKEITKKGGEI
ncbi:FecR family protein [Massilibacteroides vaginae]|uniref:FecR family protein n=1 Tax=Massilibacteroides vaginae TaxID=1673718 RepID=UPI0015941A2B|nr:FecR family protein [Massilibacteroides vaginae]